MSQTKTNKKVTLQIPGDIAVEEVLNAIRFCGKERAGAIVCSVQKMKEFILGIIIHKTFATNS